MFNAFAPDLTQHPPRSPRCKLGGYVHLPRLLDKARAVLAGKGGDYHYNCPLDRRFFDFTGIDHEAMFAAVEEGRTDTQMLAWVEAHTTKSPADIKAWSEWLTSHAAGSIDMHLWFAETIKTLSPDREDIVSFFDLLDLDDYHTYGGK